MDLFYNNNIDLNTKDFDFSIEESKHICKVLRKKIGDKISVTNGKGLEWNGILTKIESQIVSIKKNNAYLREDIRNEIEIAISPVKSRERIEWLIEKAVEIGAKTIHFIKTDNCERKKINLSRLHKIAISAMKQSNQFYLTKINDILSFESFIKTNPIKQKFIAHCENTSKTHIANITLEDKSSLILIGPEGDFSIKEIELAFKNKFIPITLGNQRLRTETAAISAIQTFSTLFHLKKNNL